jgi:hypothetical protein
VDIRLCGYVMAAKFFDQAGGPSDSFLV